MIARSGHLVPLAAETLLACERLIGRDCSILVKLLGIGPLLRLRVLGNQLLLQSLMTRRPEIQDRPVERPIVIVGFFRTGTTLVQRLLGCDPRLRSLAQQIG